MDRQTFWNVIYWAPDGRLSHCEQVTNYDQVIDDLLEAEDSGRRSYVDVDFHEDGGPGERVDYWQMVYERRCDNAADIRHAAGVWR